MEAATSVARIARPAPPALGVIVPVVAARSVPAGETELPSFQRTGRVAAASVIVGGSATVAASGIEVASATVAALATEVESGIAAVSATAGVLVTEAELAIEVVLVIEEESAIEAASATAHRSFRRAVIAPDGTTIAAIVPPTFATFPATT